jgi:tetratricopeptide (TPR) repeat protein
MERASSQSQKLGYQTKEYPQAVLELDKQLESEPHNAMLWYKRGLFLGDERLMHDAIHSLSRSIALDPFCGIYYRWRGHRHINISQIPEACADLVVASRLIPDNWDVWYHLGLTHVLLGNYELAQLAYRKCAKVPTERASNIICLSNWHFLSLMLQGKQKEAHAILCAIPDDMTCSDYNFGYLDMINFYKGKLDEDAMLKVDPELTDEACCERIYAICTHGFGMAMYYYALGEKERARKVLDYMLTTGKDISWNTFGYAGAYYVTHYREM